VHGGLQGDRVCGEFVVLPVYIKVASRKGVRRDINNFIFFLKKHITIRVVY
jgi:hypothetical protein